MLIIETFNSTADIYGNRYFAIRATNGDKSAIGTISGGESNVRAGLYRLFGDNYETVRQHCHAYETERKIREFNRETKGASYAGCTQEQIAAWIVANVGPVVGAAVLATA